MEILLYIFIVGRMFVRRGGWMASRDTTRYGKEWWSLKMNRRKRNTAWMNYWKDTGHQIKLMIMLCFTINVHTLFILLSRVCNIKLNIWLIELQGSSVHDHSLPCPYCEDWYMACSYGKGIIHVIRLFSSDDLYLKRRACMQTASPSPRFGSACTSRWRENGAQKRKDLSKRTRKQSEMTQTVSMLIKLKLNASSSDA